MGNNKGILDHEYPILQESTEEMDVDKPWGNSKNKIDYIMTDKPSWLPTRKSYT